MDHLHNAVKTVFLAVGTLLAGVKVVELTTGIIPISFGNAPHPYTMLRYLHNNRPEVPALPKPMRAIVHVPIFSHQAYDDPQFLNWSRDFHHDPAMNTSSSLDELLSVKKVNVSGISLEVFVFANTSSHNPHNLNTAPLQNPKVKLLTPEDKHPLFSLRPFILRSMRSLLRMAAEMILCHNYAIMSARIFDPKIILAFVGVAYGLRKLETRQRLVACLRAKIASVRALRLVHVDYITTAQEHTLLAAQRWADEERTKSDALFTANKVQEAQQESRMAHSTARRFRIEAAVQTRRAARLRTINDQQSRTISQHKERGVQLSSENSTLQPRAERAETSLQTGSDDGRQSARRISELENTVEERNSQLKGKDKDFKEHDKQLEKSEKALKKKTDQLKTQNGTVAKYQKDIKSLKGRLEELKPEELEKLKQRLLDAETASKAAVESAERLQAEIETLDAQNRHQAREATERDGANEGTIQALRAQLYEALEAKQKAERRASEELDRSNSEIEERGQRFGDLAPIESNEATLKQNTAEIRRLENLFETTNTKKQASWEQISQSGCQKEEMAAQLAVANSQILELQRQVQLVTGPRYVARAFDDATDIHQDLHQTVVQSDESIYTPQRPRVSLPPPTTEQAVIATGGDDAYDEDDKQSDHFCWSDEFDTSTVEQAQSLGNNTSSSTGDSRANQGSAMGRDTQEEATRHGTDEHIPAVFSPEDAETVPTHPPEQGTKDRPAVHLPPAVAPQVPPQAATFPNVQHDDDQGFLILGAANRERAQAPPPSAVKAPPRKANPPARGANQRKGAAPRGRGHDKAQRGATPDAHADSFRRQQALIKGKK